MMTKTLVCIFCAVLPALAVDFGLGAAGNIGMGFSKWEMDVRDAQGNLIADHLSSRELIYGLGPAASFWFNENFGLNIGLQYSWYNYNYTYPGTVEMKWSYKNLIFPADLKIGIPFGKNRAFIGGGILVFKQLNGEMNGINIPDDYLKTSVSPRFLIGAEFYSGNMGYQTLINYHYGLDGVDERFEGSPISTHHLTVAIGILYYFGKGDESNYDIWW